MLVDGGLADANVDTDNEPALNSLLDAQVEITGAVSGQFDNKMQQTGILFHIQSLDGIKVLKRASSDPWSLAATPMDRVITGYKNVDQSQRMRVEGVVTYYQPGSALVLQDGSHSLWVATQSYTLCGLATGPTPLDFLMCRMVSSPSRGARSGIATSRLRFNHRLFTWHELASGGNVTHGKAFDLVSTEGTVVAEVRQSTEDEYVLQTGRTSFPPSCDIPAPTALLPHRP